MEITDEDRYELYERVTGSCGNKAANTLMQMLPPVGWADVATKEDLAGLEERMGLRFQLVDKEFALLRAEFGERFDTFEAKFGGRFDTFEAKFGVRFDTIEAKFGVRFDTIEAKFGERLEHELRRQSTKFVAWLFTGLGLFSVISGIVARVV